MRPRPTLFFLLLLTSLCGASLADVMFSDVIPIRPYDGFFKWLPQFQNTFRNTAPRLALGSILTVALLILIVASFAVNIANLSTGITVAHQGFTPNPNVTGTPGLVSLDRVLPLVALGIGAGFALDELGGIL